jgi:hypothetical protein
MGDWLNLLGAVVVTALGLMGVFAPRVAANFVRIAPTGTTGISEVRATYGGVFLGLGLTALIVQQPTLFTAIGVGFGLAALVRLVSVWLDNSREPYNLAGIAFEGGIALLLLV